MALDSLIKILTLFLTSWEFGEIPVIFPCASAQLPMADRFSYLWLHNKAAPNVLSSKATIISYYLSQFQGLTGLR